MSQRSTNNLSRSSRLTRGCRKGLTLVELLMVAAVMGILATAMAGLATTVQLANEQQLGRGLAIQHGQVAIERIERAISGAFANEEFPGFVVFSETVGGETFSDTLVVWNPTSDPVSPDGLPRVNELVVFAPDYNDPTKLVEIRDESDTSEVPALSDAYGWEYLVEALRNSYMEEYGSGGATLTDLLRTAAVTNTSQQSLGTRGCVRFERQLRPTESEWQDYKDGNTAWEDLPWALGVYGATVGQRQALCRVELQLRPGDVETNDKAVAIPFFGSGAIYYQLER